MFTGWIENKRKLWGEMMRDLSVCVTTILIETGRNTFLTFFSLFLFSFSLTNSFCLGKNWETTSVNDRERGYFLIIGKRGKKIRI